jgi:tRNA (guanine37-N1)-methyltransferase
MIFHIITIFPEIFNSYFNESIIKRAQKEGHIKIEIHNLRDWTTDKHRTVDDTPYGGGAGMVMRADIIYRAVHDLTSHISHRASHAYKNSTIPKTRDTRCAIRDVRTILFSAKGKLWNQQLARKYSNYENIVMVCGRYEGVDERVRKFVDDEVSVGPYVLTGGEIPAMIVVDSIARLIPGVLGNKESLSDESFNQLDLKSKISNLKSLECPHYTRPEIFTDDSGKKNRVPKILLSGDHKKIATWRANKMKLPKKYF